MEIPEILHHLESSSDEFPRTAVADAIGRQDQITPELLRILEDVATNPSDYADRQDYFGHIYAMYLLAKFRETRAYPIIIRIVSVPGETIFDLLGDIVTQNLGSILASVSGNDVSGMQALIEDKQANDFVRDAAMRGLVTLVATAQRSRDEIMDYFAGLFRRLDRKWNFVWTGLTDYCTAGMAARRQRVVLHGAGSQADGPLDEPWRKPKAKSTTARATRSISRVPSPRR
jgi:hypothetical protein